MTDNAPEGWAPGVAGFEEYNAELSNVTTRIAELDTEKYQKNKAEFDTAETALIKLQDAYHKRLE